MISVIIPVYNDERILEKKESYFKNLAKSVELIFVNGQSTDGTKTQAEKLARVISARKGRAFQMNVGASEASGDILLFVTPENVIDLSTLPAIEQAYREKFVGGCFFQIIENTNPFYQLLTWTGNLRAKNKKIFLVEQGIFIRKDAFDHIGGFPQVPVCEDMLLSDVLKGQGKVVVLAHSIIFKPEKKVKVISGILFNLRILLSFRKMALHKLARSYMDLK